MLSAENGNLTNLPCQRQRSYIHSFNRFAVFNMGKICSKKLITIVGCNLHVSGYHQRFTNSFITHSVERICPKTWK